MNNYNFRTLPFPALISLLVLSDLLYCCSQSINPLSLIPSHPTYCKCVFTNMRKKTIRKEALNKMPCNNKENTTLGAK